ncbi:sugar transporter SWEET1-like [Asterias rubens]|uniref:sugar transporter SWEET1-like n=1 Tax=Asterias rubens TaxID=7604 RepID=UPI001455083D|nr:sugar transporter SWEET1-like [Asterias rubens]
MDWVQLLSNVTICCTIGMFMAGIPDCFGIIRTGSTENVIFLPFLMTNMNNIMWFFYGYLKQDSTLMIVNSVGSFLQSSYMIVFIFYTKSKLLPFQRTVAAFIAMVTLYMYLTSYTSTSEAVLNQLGLICSSVTVLMYFSPLAEIATVIRTQSAKGISLPLTITTLIASSLWVFYGKCVNDLYIQVPNIPGIVSSLLRIILLWKYKDNSVTASSS